MPRSSVLAVVLGLPSLVACAPMSSNLVPNPSEITLKQAMLSVADSFAAMKQATQSNKTGMLPCAVDVTFNLGANASDKNTLGVDLSKTFVAAPLTAVVNPSAGYEGLATANRSNAVTVKMVHLACLSKDTLMGSQNLTLGQVGDALDDRGIGTWSLRLDRAPAGLPPARQNP